MDRTDTLKSVTGLHDTLPPQSSVKKSTIATIRALSPDLMIVCLLNVQYKYFLDTLHKVRWARIMETIEIQKKYKRNT